MKTERFIFSPISVNTYVLWDETGECAVIDCGCYDEEEFSRLTEFIDGKGLNPVLLLNTHCHLDHVFGNGMFLKKYGLRTMACVNEEANRKNSPTHALMFGLQMATPPEIGEYVEEGQVVRFGGTELKALFVPGHSAGSVAWYSESGNCVFTGDALFAGGIGRTDLPGGNFDQLVGNIRSKLLTLPPETVVYPGHGDSSTVARENSTNPWLS